MIKIAKILANDTIEIPEIRVLGSRRARRPLWGWKSEDVSLTVRVLSVKRDDGGLEFQCEFDGVPWNFQSTHLVAKFKDISPKIVLITNPLKGDTLRVTYNLNMSGDFV